MILDLTTFSKYLGTQNLTLYTYITQRWKKYEKNVKAGQNFFIMKR